MELKDKDELILNLTAKLPLWANDKELLERVKKYYTDKDIPASDALKILNKRTTLEFLSEMNLCIFTNSIYQVTKDSSIDPKKYFADDKLVLEKIYTKTTEENERVHVFHDVSQIVKGHWVANTTSFGEVAHLADINFIGYNFKTQRQATILLRGKEIIRIPTLNKTNLKEIYELMKVGDFTSTTISFNYQHDAVEDMKYNAEARTLTVTLKEDDVLYIIDGFHRTLEMCALEEESPNFPATTSINIFNYTEERAKKYIHQMAQGQGMPEWHLEDLSEKNLSTTIAKYINETFPKDNGMFSKIASNFKEVKLNTKYTTLDIMSMAIRECFNVTNETDDRMLIKEIKDVILKGLNEIITLKKRQFNSMEENRKTSILTFSGSFMMYIAIIARLYKLGYTEESSMADKDKFHNKIEEILKKINFSITNKEWKALGIVTPKNMMSTSLSVIDCDRIQEYVKDVLTPNEIEIADRETALSKEESDL